VTEDPHEPTDALSPGPIFGPLDPPPEHARRAKTVSHKEIRRELRHSLWVVEPPLSDEEERHRPRTRADCIDGERPCPFVGCRHHLYLDVTEVGSIKFNFPNLELEELPTTCALDVADISGTSLDQVGFAMNLTRERVRQIQRMGLDRIKSCLE
jgi:hypothetical protein